MYSIKELSLDFQINKYRLRRALRYNLIKGAFIGIDYQKKKGTWYLTKECLYKYNRQIIKIES